MYVVFGKRVQRSSASLWRAEFKEVVRRILGVGGGTSVKRVGNLSEREAGVRSRFVLVAEGALDAARGRCFGCEFSLSPSSSSPSDSESNMLSASSSTASSSPPSRAACSSASSIRLLFNCSTSTLAPKPSSSTSSQTRFLSIV